WSFTVWRQAVTVAVSRTCWSLPAMSGSVERSFQSLPGVSCRRRVGPEKGSKPQKPVTVPETVVASAGAILLAGFSGEAVAVAGLASSFASSDEDRDSRGRGLRAGGGARAGPPWK